MKVTNKIPVPVIAWRGKPRTKFPFHLLKKIGDSFFVDGDKAKHGVYSSLKSYNDRVAKHPISITIRSEEGGVRVWRVSGNKKKK